MPRWSDVDVPAAEARVRAVMDAEVEKLRGLPVESLRWNEKFHAAASVRAEAAGDLDAAALHAAMAVLASELARAAILAAIVAAGGHVD